MHTNVLIKFMKQTLLNHRKRISITLLSSCALIALVNINVNAADPPQTSQAIEISPPVVTVTAKPGEVVKTQISLRDVSTVRLVATNEINDFTAAGEDGTPKLLLEEGQKSPYSMKEWISPLPQLTLNPKKIEILPINIRVPANAAPGGYYAVIRFTATPADIDTNGVSLSASLGALVLLTVEGDVKENMSVVEFSAQKNAVRSTLFESIPLTFRARVKNEGNIHEQPTGKIVITDMFGKDIAGVNVNLARRNVLPGSIRRFDSPLDKSVVGNQILFGRYSAKLSLTYGAKSQVITSNLTFWIIPWKLILAVILGLVGLFFLLKTLIRRYNNYIVGRASNRSKRR